MGTEEIDEIFQEGTQEHFPYDEKLWADVESQLPPINRKRRGFVYWPIALALVVGLGTAGVFLVTPSQNADPKIAETPVIKKVSKDPKASNKLASSPSNVSNLQQESPNAKENTPYNSLNKVEGLLTKHSSQDMQVGDSQLAMKKEIEAEQSIPSKVQNVIDSKENLDLKNYPAEEGKKGISTDAIEAEQPAFAFLSDSLNQMAILGIHQKYLVLSPLQAKQVTAYPTKKSSPLSIELQYNRSIELKDRSRSEARVSANQIAVLGIKDIGSFNYGVGFRYSRMVERVSFNQDEEKLVSNIEYDTNIVIVDGNYNQNGEPIILVREEINSTTIVDMINERSKISSENILETVQIPVFVGYKQAIGNFQIGIRSALVMNYLYRAEGVYLNEDRDVIELANGKPSESIYFNVEGDFRFGYRLSEFSLIGSSVRYQYALSEMQPYRNTALDGTLFGIWIQHQFK